MRAIPLLLCSLLAAPGAFAQTGTAPALPSQDAPACTQTPANSSPTTSTPPADSAGAHLPAQDPPACAPGAAPVSPATPAQSAPAGAYPPGAYPPGAYVPNTYPPGAYPPGTYAPNTYPPGTYAPNTYPPGTYAPNTYPPGTYAPNTYPPGTYAPNTYPPGTYAPNTYPPGTYPPGTYPPGTYPPGTYPPGTYPANAPQVDQRIRLTKPEPKREEVAEDSPHRGLYTRYSLGLGVGHFGNGSLPPKPGFKPVRDLNHTAPVLSLASQLGAGANNLAIAVEFLYEQTLRNYPEPSEVGFHLLALGLAASYYLPHDLFLTGHLRWVGLILRMPDCLCLSDELDSTSGPGLGLTLGKEWFVREGASSDDLHGEEYRGRRRKLGIGLALQGNYARFTGEPSLEYVSGLVLLTLTRF